MPDNRIKRAKYWRPVCERVALLIAYLLGVAEFAVFILTLGFYGADWRANWLFSDACGRLIGD